MLKSCCLLLLLLQITLSFADPPADYELKWSDEFDGNDIDRGRWNVVNQGGRDTGNDEQQFYTDRSTNVFVADGILNLKANQENFDNYAYTSGKVTSVQANAFGYFEIRAKIPSGKGLWPAIWLLPIPAKTKYGTWASCGEIDMMETVNTDGQVYGTLHFGGEWPRNQQYPPSNQNILADVTDRATVFHTYSVLWTESSIQWQIDGVTKQTVASDKWFSMDSDGNRFPSPAPFDQPFNVILNLAVGGAWPCGVGGCPPDAGVFPSTLEIDYVRVYQQKGTGRVN